MTKDINYSIEEIDKTAKIVLSLNPSAKIFIFNGHNTQIQQGDCVKQNQKEMELQKKNYLKPNDI